MKRILWSIACILLISGAWTNECSAKKKDDTAKYVFLFIGDGMGFHNVALAESYLSYKAGKLGGENLIFTEFPVHGTATTHSANRRVTDSSASGTAIATGIKTNNSVLGKDSEGNNLLSMGYDLQERGYNIAVMSSVPINHATPASFYGRNGSRYSYYEITQDIPGSDFQFFAASGILHYFGKKGDMESSEKMLEDEGINVCFGLEEGKAAVANGDRVLLCQPYNKDKEPDNYHAGGKMPEGHIRLSEMLELGLESLGENKPFFIMCEGGDIDWAAHSRKTMPTVFNVLAFNEAITVAYEFYLKHPKETLIVVSADHGTGGVAMTAEPNWEGIEKAWIEAGYTNELSKSENKKLNEENNFLWPTGSHTGDPVPVYAIGKGAEKFAGRMDNTEFKAKILGK